MFRQIHLENGKQGRLEQHDLEKKTSRLLAAAGADAGRWQDLYRERGLLGTAGASVKGTVVRPSLWWL